MKRINKKWVDKCDKVYAQWTCKRVDVNVNALRQLVKVAQANKPSQKLIVGSVNDDDHHHQVCTNSHDMDIKACNSFKLDRSPTRDVSMRESRQRRRWRRVSTLVVTSSHCHATSNNVALPITITHSQAYIMEVHCSHKTFNCTMGQHGQTHEYTNGNCIQIAVHLWFGKGFQSIGTHTQRLD